jgi:hypothetical protein
MLGTSLHAIPRMGSRLSSGDSVPSRPARGLSPAPIGGNAFQNLSCGRVRARKRPICTDRGAGLAWRSSFIRTAQRLSFRSHRGCNSEKTHEAQKGIGSINVFFTFSPTPSSRHSSGFFASDSCLSHRKTFRTGHRPVRSCKPNRVLRLTNQRFSIERTLGVARV